MVLPASQHIECTSLTAARTQFTYPGLQNTELNLLVGYIPE